MALPRDFLGTEKLDRRGPRIPVRRRCPPPYFDVLADVEECREHLWIDAFSGEGVAFCQHGNRIVAVQAFLMTGHDPEVTNAHVRQELLAEKPCRVLDKDRICGVQFGKGLLVLALDHYLRFGGNGAATCFDQVLEPQAVCIVLQHHGHPRDRTLRMGRRQLAPRGAGMLGQLQRTGAGRRIDVVEMHDLFAHPALLYQLQRDIVILIAGQPRAQAFYLHGEAEAHLDARVKTLKVRLVVVQSRLDDLKAEGLSRMLVEGAHDPGHVDALFVRLKTDSACHRRFKRQRLARSGLHPQRQAKVRDANVLDLLFRTADQAGGAILQVGQRVFIRAIHGERLWIGPVKRRVSDAVASGHKPGDRRVEFENFGCAGRVRPTAQQIQGCLSLVAFGYCSDVGRMNVHKVAPPSYLRLSSM
mmetsp:Transcript_29137/g.56143  ORF Transcript_29137/g.56143 Transcript_29137/m.56143 type:complete len:415 (-) Transcript_29137:1270-2514(-)